ncbi:hypothetical protein HB779_05465 [Phyllobacterium sp. 628]|uniref:hypothetical protein n=1 Tax=Phyllobacterium sp. 628 TaxID=2718938 RepID=UPI0016628755|nr:hypothetical protein [Phyllobacterium sp. 628]QND51408.1 hypothetical protein HB779_05465 [Phyllobacterium sp. 628]
MAELKSISLAELRAATTRLLDSLEERGVSHIPLEKDVYWRVNFHDVFNEERPEPVQSSVEEGWNDLKAELSDPSGIAHWHAFHHLAGLMKTVAYADLRGALTAPASRRVS